LNYTRALLYFPAAKMLNPYWSAMNNLQPVIKNKPGPAPSGPLLSQRSPPLCGYVEPPRFSSSP